MKRFDQIDIMQKFYWHGLIWNKIDAMWADCGKDVCVFNWYDLVIPA